MKWIVITSPDFVDGEELFINRLFGRGLDLLHFRKPGASAEKCRSVIGKIDTCWHHRIVVHDNFQLCSELNLGGVHLNGRNPIPPEEHKGMVSRSCHSLKELEDFKDKCDYLTLSPIFNSVSKQGYMSAFTDEQLCDARDRGLIDGKVVALGGVTLQNIPKIKAYGFGGVAILGDVWQRIHDEDVDEYLIDLRKALQ